ncbi:hypothetical protein N7326_04760 [Corynebacterium sp. ES2794-CONJ1]|uniref:MazG nucleotide pyrophosphohydrolase domain-containing protein n=1 Tax=unclassified Corynebacterium TaxID=2624378 RepID=UPI0021675460|nr:MULTISPECIES: MazG nucleotide pyrophosphohydrolase domain-containing protein [unclassified Corynebacterium]MCS4489954.1 hypothetical protein [Corynebacterium sp. ES2775-CONJ]MCS4491683.1 hypothetical protein [Corynebacterium sp. ES2715-CONJ3]MCS4531788.1 hypothetical protein [Corynebacterium sp. ES2730-CONJ]MCU9519184.1 hypothetical protein [Corynebacterium sp. ES2794-CONJ1]
MTQAHLTVLILDPRWPTMVPLNILKGLRGSIEVTEDIPEQLLSLLKDLIPAGPEILLVSSQPNHPAVKTFMDQDAVLICAPSLEDPVDQAVQTMRRALEIGEWERAQTHRSLIPYLREETAEVIEAIESESGDDQIRNELSDVLLQVFFHAEIAARRGAFDFADIASSFTAKMRRRAPYLFDGTTETIPTEKQQDIWQKAKLMESEKQAQP